MELAGLHERLRAAEGLKSELEEAKAQYDKIRSQVEEIDGRNKELNDTLAELKKEAEQVFATYQYSRHESSRCEKGRGREGDG